MLRERLVAPRNSWLVPSLLAAIACSSASSSDPGTEDGPGVELESWRAREGTVSIVGASPSVPVSNQSWSGYREGSNEFVRCTHDPAGLSSDRPSLRIEAGLSARTTALLSLFDLVTPSPVSATYTSSSHQGPFSEFTIEVSLSPDLDDGAYVYAAGVDANVDPPAASSCALDITRFDVDALVGTFRCEGLLPVEDSPDRPITNAPYPRADVTLTFDCPLLTLTDDPGAGSGGTTGSGGTDSGGGGGTGGGTGGSGVEPSCQGTATSCSSLSGPSCSLSVGCSPDGECSGSATSCYYLFDSFSCYAQSGCYWSNGDCQGFASSCSSQLSEYTCGDQDGCTWSDTCDGVALSCSSFSSASDCDAQPGCYWL